MELKEILPLLGGPAGVAIFASVAAYLLWTRNGKLQDDLTTLVKDSIKSDLQTTEALRELTRAVGSKS